MLKEVFCSLQVEGTHYWKDCPLKEVFYLRDVHRHMFHITAYKKVSHLDRDLEFICLKHKIQNYLITKYNVSPSPYESGFDLCVFGPLSCEQIAEELINQFNLSKCMVSEDGENGCILTVRGATDA